MNTLTIASHSRGKLLEYQKLLSHSDYLMKSLSINDPEPEETGNSYIENARIKAESARKLYPAERIVADDSGVELKGLNGKPGILSARYPDPTMGVAANARATVAELYSQDSTREATYFCNILLLETDGRETVFEGSLGGYILETPRGENSTDFGYESYFVPEGEKKTLAELGETKHLRSARREAVEKMLAHLALS